MCVCVCVCRCVCVAALISLFKTLLTCKTKKVNVERRSWPFIFSKKY